MGMSFSRRGGASSLPRVIGNGIVVHADGQLFGRSIYGIGGQRIDRGDGIDGDIAIHATPGGRLLGKGVGLDGASSAEQVIPIFGGVTRFSITMVRFANARGAPDDDMAAGIRTLPAGNGLVVVAATQKFDGLTDIWKEVRVPVALGDVSAVPYFYLQMATVNTTPITFDVYIHGDVLEQELA